MQLMIKHLKQKNRDENKVKKDGQIKLTDIDKKIIIRKFVKNSCLSVVKVNA